jgi:hypothetical protein
MFALIPINSDLQQKRHHSCEAGITYVIASVFHFEEVKNRHTHYLLIDKKFIILLEILSLQNKGAKKTSVNVLFSI